MNRLQRMYLAATACGAMVLTGCGTSSGIAGEAAPAANTTRPVVAGSAGATPPASPGKGSRVQSAAGGAGPAPRCRLTDLSAKLTEPVDPAKVKGIRINLVWTNKSSTPCTMRGFSGVDLHGDADPTFGAVYSLPRQQVAAKLVQLAPGQSAHTALHLLPGYGEPNGWVPRTVVATPPGGTRHVTLPWPGNLDGPIQRQDGATHPVTYIGPVVAGVK